MFKLLFCACILGGMVSTGMALAGDRPAGRPSAGRSAVWARHGMVATSQPLAVQAGLRVLQQGGNAIDAAIATAAMLNLVEPMSTGIGGDVFALVYIARTGELKALNASGFSPACATREFFAKKGLSEIPMFGAQSVSVPGALDGWVTLLNKYGAMKLDQVLAPAIEYAEKGFPVSEIIADSWQGDGLAAAQRDPEFAKAYLIRKPDGAWRGPAEGEVFVNKPLAETFRKIAAGGRDVFYKGEIGRKLVARLNELGWPITMDDLAYQHSDWVEPISTTYKGYRVYELPPNSQGMAVLEMLNILEGFELRKLGHNSAPYLHLLVEAKRLAFADLDAWNADPGKARLPIEQIISKDYARKQRAKIDSKRAMPSVVSGIPSTFDWRRSRGDTIYLTVVDSDRNVVSFINSNFQNFGSSVVVPGTGIVLHDRGALFQLAPNHPNTVEPHKRPYQTLIPAMVFKDNKPWLSFGVMGGDMQPQGHVQVLLNMFEFGMNVQDAGEAPRFRHAPGNGLTLESGIDYKVAEQLAAMGHPIVSDPGKFGGYQAIQIDWKSGALAGGTDPRKDGCAAGW